MAQQADRGSEDPIHALVDANGVPRFETARPEQVAPTLRALIAQHRALIARLLADPTPPSWERFFAPLDALGEQLDRSWNLVDHMVRATGSSDWRDSFEALLPEVASHWAEVGQDGALYRRHAELLRIDLTLSPQRRRVLELRLRDMRLSGAQLPEPDQRRLVEVLREKSVLAARYDANLVAASMRHVVWVTDAARLAGLPEDVQAAALQAARNQHRTGWALQMVEPTWLAVMTQAEDRALRHEVWQAWTDRATSRGAPELDNGPVIEGLLALRAEEARLLGFDSAAELSLVPRMARSPGEVLDFLRSIARQARPKAERELTQLRAFAAEQLGLTALEPWDVLWASEKLRQSRHGYSSETVRQYFTEPQVIDGLFAATRLLYGVQITAEPAPTWHPSVGFYRIEQHGQRIGGFWLDLHSRPGKTGGAWMNGLRSRHRDDRGLTTPLAVIVCNVAPPGDTRPALLNWGDVTTLLHEFGHALHELLTEVDERTLAGTRTVERDAVELASQFMEHFCRDPGVLGSMTAHVRTGETLPADLVDRLLAARHFQSGLTVLQFVEFGLFDMRLHAELARPGARPSIAEVQALLGAVRNEVAVLNPPARARTPQSFAHVFAWGYEAGYYSYQWAEVMSSDAFAVFEAAPRLLDAASGARFRQEILAMGSSRPALDSFRAFRGRDPQIGAMLRLRGLGPD